MNLNKKLVLGVAFLAYDAKKFETILAYVLVLLVVSGTMNLNQLEIW